MEHDIDRIIAGVRRLHPDVVVVQMSKYLPADDDGLWWFRLPDVDPDIQVESSSYDCPFIVEHSGMKSSSEAIHVNFVEEGVHIVDRYLRSLKAR
ncbi:hypothetical protein DES53_105185 [Roseimicrobium gellanilyticum]|uniref:Uncharacterized protein n=1 Tax=Roseimicrobium gellanilyticum TaxID=748857 RepID=A0A366HMW4_9BACT|nr:hypothetical protein [Roseimicrobium gellanilyticum]RBP43786.1 hypothetical protein DES53_105185 [Roseimicrobium gellanilyticum]